MKYILLIAAALMLPAGQTWCAERSAFGELFSAGGDGEAVSAALPGAPARDPAAPAAARAASGMYLEWETGNKLFSPDLVADLRARFSGEKGVYLLPSKHSGLPSVGSPKMLVLLIDFDEYPARPQDTSEAMAARIFGSAGKFPFESLTAFYRRSSYGKLNIGGEALGWYRAGKRADVPRTFEGREALIKKALQSFSGYNLSRYDNNGDGVIDYLTVIWTGPADDWRGFWWGGMTHFSDNNFTVNGEKLDVYTWEGAAEDWANPASGFKIRTLVHETGHALGLPDYYDYTPGVGPGGGLGLFDMMDSTYFDHNCFSKFMLGWIEPTILTSGGEFRLPPVSGSGECLLLMPPGRENNPFGEFFLVENRRNTGNDTTGGFTGGLVVWHVDARLNADGTNFLYNNQDTEHKLLKALEADGQERLERGLVKWFDYADFYGKGRALGPDTVPSSRLYDGRDTGITLLSRGGDNDAELTVTYATPR